MIRWFKKRREEKEKALEAQEIRDMIASFGQEEMDRLETIVDIFENGWRSDIYNRQYKKWFKIHHLPGLYYNVIKNGHTFKDVSEMYVDSFYLNTDRFLSVYIHR